MRERKSRGSTAGSPPSLIEQINQTAVTAKLLLRASKAMERATDANTLEEMVKAIADDLQEAGYTIGQGAVLGITCHFRLAALAHYMTSNGRSFAAEGQPGGDDMNLALLQCAGIAPLADDDGPTRFKSGYMDSCLAAAASMAGSA